MKKLTTWLWLDGQAEAAANFYTSVFKDGAVADSANYGDVGEEITGQKPGSVMMVQFEIMGQQFAALNGGPQFKFTEAISFEIPCENQEEVDYYWEKLSAVPEAEQCGWVKDKFGVSWQIVPVQLGKLMSDPDREKVNRVTQAMLGMKKLDIAGLEAAYNG